MADTLIRALVAVEGLDAFDVQRAMPDDPNFELVGMTDGVDDTVRMLQTRQVDVLLVACQGREDDRSLQIIDGAHRAAGDLPIIVLSTSSPNGFLRRAFDVGAADMALFPQTKEQLRFAMSKAIARAPRKGFGASSSHDGRLVCVLGPKGGTGKTLTSCNLAVALALAGQKVLIIDLDLQFGDVGLCLGLPPEKTMYDLAVSGGSLDEDKLGDYIMTHDTGVDVLLAPARPDQASAITIELLRDVLVVARGAYDYVISDTPPGFTAEVIATIDASSDLVMVGTLDSLSLEEHEARSRDARADGVRQVEDPARPEPRGHARGDQPARRRGGPRERAEHLHPVGPRDPALGQRGHSDHPLSPAVLCGRLVPRPRRAVRHDQARAERRATRWRPRERRPSAATRSLFRFKRK